jgi:hypothetical protein
MFFDYWISFYNETYLFLAVCAGLNICNLKWHSYGDITNSLIALLVSTILVFLPFFVGIFYNLRKNYARILKLDTDFLARFGSIISGLNFKRQGCKVLIHSCATLTRKLWLAYITVF